ncbi:MAG TPA: peroxide stress protein YaaA [Actinomycetes bacterium]
MLLLLPPSEGKAQPNGRRRPLDLTTVSFPELTPVRQRVMDHLVALCSGDETTAAEVLGLSPGLIGEVARNRDLATAPTLPASQLFTGVLYEALDLASLKAAATRRANRSVLVFSGLFGVLRPTDRVPAHRLAADVSLPGVGPVASLWRAALDDVMAAAAGRSGLVLDLRSSAYAAMWRPTGEPARRTVSVRVLHERRPGDPTSRVVVSHFNKATKGRLARALLLDGAQPTNRAGVIEMLGGLGFHAEPSGQGRVDVVVEAP